MSQELTSILGFRNRKQSASIELAICRPQQFPYTTPSSIERVRAVLHRRIRHRHANLKQYPQQLLCGIIRRVTIAQREHKKRLGSRDKNWPKHAEYVVAHRPVQNCQPRGRAAILSKAFRDCLVEES
jgi:hypothetical protein